MPVDLKKGLKKKIDRSYLAKDLESFRAELLQYARVYFPDKIKDFSESSLGGLFIDMASMVGDSMSFYLDHQFGETDWSTAVETKNIQKHLKSSGVPIVGASPSVANVTFFIKVPFETIDENVRRPKRSALPVILEGTTVQSLSGVSFNLVEDVDFSKLDSDNQLLANVIASKFDSSGNPIEFILSLEGTCVSGFEVNETFSIPDIHTPFREITLSNGNTSEILSVRDSDGNTFYEVESLSQDTVFQPVLNSMNDSRDVTHNLEVISAPRRFTKETNLKTRQTTLTFGAGDAETLDDDIIPDPSKLSLPLYGKKTFTRFSIDPGNLLKTQTLGISPRNTTLTVSYRYGGGLHHNVAADTIRTVSTISMQFRNSPESSDAQFVRSSIDVKNTNPASGGENAPSIQELRTRIPSARQLQSRIVSSQDMLARVYTMPTQFGRVFRAGVGKNNFGERAVNLYIISKDSAGRLSISPDALKKNLRIYLNEFRLISDAIDILDTTILNFGINFSVVVHPTFNKSIVVQDAIGRLRSELIVDNFQIDQPIVLDDITNIIINTQGVVSLIDLDVTSLTNDIENRIYSNISFEPKAQTFHRIVTGSPGSIFELRYPESDIIGAAV